MEPKIDRENSPRGTIVRHKLNNKRIMIIAWMPDDVFKDAQVWAFKARYVKDDGSYAVTLFYPEEVERLDL